MREKNSEALLQETENLEGLPPGKIIGKAFSRNECEVGKTGVSRKGLSEEKQLERPFRGKTFGKAIARKKIFILDFSSGPPPDH